MNQKGIQDDLGRNQAEERIYGKKAGGGLQKRTGQGSQSTNLVANMVARTHIFLYFFYRK
jgi:hypothetical protein